MSADFTSLQDQKAFLGIAVATATWDALLATLITQKTRSIVDYCQDNIEATDYIDDYNGEGFDKLILRHKPIVSVAYIRSDYNRVFGVETAIDPTLYAFDADPGIIELRGYSLAYGTKNVRVSYRAGYATVPTSVVLACQMWVGHVFEQRKDRGLTNQSLGNRSYGLDLTAIPVDVAALLGDYVQTVRMA